MPPKKRSKHSHQQFDIEIEENDENFDVIMIPSLDDSQDFESDSDSDSENEYTDLSSFIGTDIPIASYHQVLDTYSVNQKKLEPNHVYEWLDGEKVYGEELGNEFLLPESVSKKIRNYSSTDLFEIFFSNELKAFIIDATICNGGDLSLQDLETFLGIIILSIFNSRKSQRDYWSSNPLLACEPVKSAMSRNKFEKIKSEIKLSKNEDKNIDDRAWRVRVLLDTFRKNCQQFGFFSTALSIDECMIKFYGRSVLKQFMKGKPVRFGLKLWAICNKEGFIFDFDIYCGKGSNHLSSKQLENLSSCALGSRIVLQMLQKLLTTVTPRNISRYHIYFDNFFSSPDLLVHLRKIGLRATGTVRANRVSGVTMDVDKKSKRGTYSVKHDKNSGINYVTVMDSKIVSLLSTTAGVTPLSTARRYSKDEHDKVEISCPNAFKQYNNFMGGVDQHDFYCSNLLPCIRSKKWTWVVLMRILQASITNASVLKNLACNDKIVAVKDIALAVASEYLNRANNLQSHTHETVMTKRNCSNFTKCSSRTQKFCVDCRKYLCSTCFQNSHK